MNTKELIEALQKEDPSGEAEVVDVNGNCPIHFLQLKQGCWDGSYGKLVRDFSRKGYNIEGYNNTREGNKLCIHFKSVWDVLCNDPTAKVYLEGEEYDSDYYEEFRKRILEGEWDYHFRPEKKDKLVLIFECESDSEKFWSTFREEFFKWRELPGGGSRPSIACIAPGHALFCARELNPDQYDRIREMLGYLSIYPLVFQIIKGTLND